MNKQGLDTMPQTHADENPPAHGTLSTFSSLLMPFCGRRELCSCSESSLLSALRFSRRLNSPSGLFLLSGWLARSLALLLQHFPQKGNIQHWAVLYFLPHSPKPVTLFPQKRLVDSFATPSFSAPTTRLFLHQMPLLSEAAYPYSS